MSVAGRVDSHADRLTEADQAVLDVLLRDPTEAAMLSATEVADRAGVHPASVVRLAQKLGYAGYPDLRSSLRSEVVGSDSADRVSETLAVAGNSILASLVRSEIDTLTGMLRHLDQKSIDAAARAIARADRVLITAQGNSAVLAELLDRRLRRAGYRSTLALGQGRELAERLLSLTAKDMLVAFAFRRIAPEINSALAYAASVKSATVVVADQVARRLEVVPDHLLAAPRGRGEAYLTLTVPMAICNALVLSLAKLDGGRSVAALEMLDKLTSELGD